MLASVARCEYEIINLYRFMCSAGTARDKHMLAPTKSRYKFVICDTGVPFFSLKLSI